MPYLLIRVFLQNGTIVGGHLSTKTSVVVRCRCRCRHHRLASIIVEKLMLLLRSIFSLLPLSAFACLTCDWFRSVCRCLTLLCVATCWLNACFCCWCRCCCCMRLVTSSPHSCSALFIRSFAYMFGLSPVSLAFANMTTNILTDVHSYWLYGKSFRPPRMCSVHEVQLAETSCFCIRLCFDRGYIDSWWNLSRDYNLENRLNCCNFGIVNWHNRSVHFCELDSYKIFEFCWSISKT